MAILISPLVSTLQANHCIDMLSNTYGRGLSKQISDRNRTAVSEFHFLHCSGKISKIKALTMGIWKCRR